MSNPNATAILNYEIRNTDTGYKAQATYIGVTPETYGKMVQVLEGIPLQDEETLRELAAMKARKDNAYEERNRVVALLASMLAGSGTRRTAIEGWADDWHGCVYVVLPNGKQASWHYHDSQAHLFAHLPLFEGEYDGHSTELKYQRIAELAPHLVEYGAQAPIIYNKAFFALREAASSPNAPNPPVPRPDPFGGRTMTEAERDVIIERNRQVKIGYEPAHDDAHNDGQLAAAASAYALAVADKINPFSQGDGDYANVPPLMWPFNRDDWKPGDPRRMLVKAAALILAEIERLDRQPKVGAGNV